MGDKLGELRDTCLFVLTVANVLWLVFMITVMEQDDDLNVLGSSFASVAFLAVYTLVLVFQFLSMLWHRCDLFFLFITPGFARMERNEIKILGLIFQHDGKSFVIDGPCISERKL